MYKTSKVAQVEAQPEEQEFLGSLEDAMPPVTKNPWEVNLTLNGMPVLLKKTLEQTLVQSLRQYLSNYNKFLLSIQIAALPVLASISYKCLNSLQLI